MRLFVPFLAGLMLSGCLAYNDQCTPLVDNPNERVAFIARGTELWLDRPNARHGNNAIGQAAADAFKWVFAETDAPVDFAVVNGGSIRAEGLCITRNIVKEGPLSNGVLHEIMLFENPVQAVDLSEKEVLDMFEHSVERLFAAPAPIVSPAGSFLQVSKDVALAVDCSRPALDRVTALKINGVSLTKPGADVSQKKFRVASSSFVIAGGDGYTMLGAASADLSRNPKNAQRFGGIDSNITAAYLKQSGFNATVEDGLKSDPARIVFTNCSVPTRPSN
ncbi:MAG: 5'-nucleotidase C-terminal domain-containing protein [Myxococcota bacterium]